MREFFAQAFPYSTFINVYSSESGIPFIQGEGGAIPAYLGNYYPQNISWPGLDTKNGLWPQVWQDPVTDPAVVGSAGWWWAQITNPASSWYDPEAAACKTTTCNFPLDSELGATPFDSAVDAWGQIVKTITGGAIVTSRWDPGPCFAIFCYGVSGPGTGPYPTYPTGWFPDYPDPTDYMVPFYLPDGSYTYSAALNETFVEGDWGNLYNGCSVNAAHTFANLVYWASRTPLVPENCQGTPYVVMTWAENVAAILPVGAERTLYYNLIEHIANGLVLYVYTEQQLWPGSYASWIDPSTIDTNAMAPGQLWFFWSGTGVLS